MKRLEEARVSFASNRKEQCPASIGATAAESFERLRFLSLPAGRVEGRPIVVEMMCTVSEGRTPGSMPVPDPTCYSDS